MATTLTVHPCCQKTASCFFFFCLFVFKGDHACPSQYTLSRPVARVPIPLRFFLFRFKVSVVFLVPLVLRNDRKPGPRKVGNISPCHSWEVARRNGKQKGSKSIEKGERRSSRTRTKQEKVNQAEKRSCLWGWNLPGAFSWMKIALTGHQTPDQMKNSHFNRHLLDIILYYIFMFIFVVIDYYYYFFKQYFCITYFTFCGLGHVMWRASSTVLREFFFPPFLQNIFSTSSQIFGISSSTRTETFGEEKKSE